MALIQGRAYRLTETSEWLFRTIFPDMEKDAKYILISSEGMMTFDEEPGRVAGTLRIPHLEIHSYYDIEFENE